MLLWMYCVFLAVFSPKLNVLSLLSTILYFYHINLSGPLSPLWEEDICARGLFCTKFNYEQFLFEAFLDMRIFGSVQP